MRGRGIKKNRRQRHEVLIQPIGLKTYLAETHNEEKVKKTARWIFNPFAMFHPFTSFIPKVTKGRGIKKRKNAELGDFGFKKTTDHLLHGKISSVKFSFHINCFVTIGSDDMVNKDSLKLNHSHINRLLFIHFYLF